MVSLEQWTAIALVLAVVLVCSVIYRFYRRDLGSRDRDDDKVIVAGGPPGRNRPTFGPWIEWPRAEEFGVHSPLLVDDQSWFDVLPTLDEARQEIERWISREGTDVDALRLALAAFLSSAFVPPVIFDSQPLPDGQQVETRFSYDPATGRLLGLWSRSVEGAAR